MFLAHIRYTADGTVCQSAQEHSRSAARYAGECLRRIGLEKTGYLLGLVHDCGKFKNEFQKYLLNPNGVRGSVNHTFAGTRLLLETYHTSDNPMEKLCAELMAFAVGSHHGLFDCVDENRNSGFVHRLTMEKIHYQESKENFLTLCASRDELDHLFKEATEELTRVYPALATEKYDECTFALGMLGRLLLSSVIEGDRRDTSEFMGGMAGRAESTDSPQFWLRYLNRVEAKISEFPQKTPIDKARGRISALCRGAAERECGIYRLRVPTGGGKTLSSLRYALAHACKWGKRRIIFTSPLLSILEQNAAVIREYISDDQVILEHHSNVLTTQEDLELDQKELAMEGWHAPVIITTLVQLLNTLFEGRSTSIRRFQALCDSIIVIDEVQTVPPRMLTMFNLAMDFLAKVCKATIVLCSATQPCLENTDHPLQSPVQELISHDPKLWEPFKRTTFTDAGSKTLEEIADFAGDILEEAESLLLVCNRKDEAEYLFSRLRDGAETACHLSASMCTEHRRKVLAQMQEALAEGKKCLCISTQVIEAGVDISFSRVIRLTAGMDSVIQSAGRCNRHGESETPAQVYVVSCLGENLGKLREIRDAKQATEALLGDYRQDPEQFGSDLASEKSITAYYRRLYQNMRSNKGYQDYSIEKPRTTLYDLLSTNYTFCAPQASWYGQYFMNQAFRLAGSLFEVFDSGTRDLVVPYGEGKALIEELTSWEKPSLDFLTDWSRRARAYTVSAYQWQLKALGNAVTEHAGVAVLSQGFYDNDTGLVLRPGGMDFMEV